MADRATPAARRRRRARIRRITVSAAVVFGLGTGIEVAEAQSGGKPGYRTALATTGDTSSRLTVSATVQPVNQAQATFQVAGTVTSVDVTPGQPVTAGQTLATLETTSLQEQVSLAQARLTSAQARLSQDESGQSTTTTASTRTSSAIELTSVTIPSGTIPSESGSTTGGTTTLQQAQDAVVTAQHSADLDLQAAAASLASAERICAGTAGTNPSGPPSTTTTTPSTSTSTSSTTSTTALSTTNSTTPTQTSPACGVALDQAMTAQKQVSKDQQAVQAAETALAQILSKNASSTGAKSNTPSTTPARSQNPASTAVGSPTTAATSSATQLASDQASIDSAQANLVSAQQTLSNAKLSAPMSGTVATVGITKGQSVASGSTSSVITISDLGSYQTTSSLTSSQVGEVVVGDHVQVAIDGQIGTVTGTVARVGPVQGSSSSYSYPLIVSLAAGSIPAGTTVSGSSAQLTVDISDASGALLVPTSAVHTTSTGKSYVMVDKAGKEVRTAVQVGVVGSVYTQITSGLTAGTEVVLADPSQSVPSSSSNSTSNFRGFGGAGGFPTPPSGFTRFSNGG